MTLSYPSCSPSRARPRRINRLPEALPVVVVRPPTLGPWHDRGLAEAVRQQWIPATTPSSPTLFVLDLNMVSPSPDVLEALVGAGRDLKASGRGLASLAISTGNAGLRRMIEALAAKEHLPLYVSTSSEPEMLAKAEPTATLTATERETLDTVVEIGGRVTAADLARRLNLNRTAATNRLVAVVAKGVLRRQSRPGRDGDLFIDPRFPNPARALDQMLDAAREALLPEDFANTEKLLRGTLG
jgi:hypothetical protein